MFNHLELFCFVLWRALGKDLVSKSTYERETSHPRRRADGGDNTSAPATARVAYAFSHDARTCHDITAILRSDIQTTCSVRQFTAFSNTSISVQRCVTTSASVLCVTVLRRTTPTRALPSDIYSRIIRQCSYCHIQRKQ